MDGNGSLPQVPHGDAAGCAEAIATTASAAGIGGQKLAGAAADLLERLTTELVPGLEAEEEVVFPLLARRPQGSASIERLRDQHRRIRALTEVLAASVYRLQERAGPAGWLREPLTRLRTLLAEHRALEDEAVTEAVATLSDTDRRRLEEELTRSRERARLEIVLVTGPDYAPTEAWAMRPNGKRPRVFRRGPEA